jgi:hypothetical protein
MAFNLIHEIVQMTTTKATTLTTAMTANNELYNIIGIQQTF